MEEASSQPWFLRKHQDGSVFGPISFDQLSSWASAAQVAPQDVVSTDQQTWLKAPMLLQLGMDWLVEVTSEHYYGPTTIGAIQEFIRLGDINADTFIINSGDGTRRQIGEMPALFKTNATASKASATGATTEPAAAAFQFVSRNASAISNKPCAKNAACSQKPRSVTKSWKRNTTRFSNAAVRSLRSTSARLATRPALPPSSLSRRRFRVATRASSARTIARICRRAQSAPHACRAR